MHGGGRWGWVPCMPGCALASVSMCPCLSASLSNRCRLLFLADHLTPSSPGFLPECLGRVMGVGVPGNGRDGRAGLGGMQGEGLGGRG